MLRQDTGPQTGYLRCSLPFFVYARNRRDEPQTKDGLQALRLSSISRSRLEGAYKGPNRVPFFVVAFPFDEQKSTMII